MKIIKPTLTILCLLWQLIISAQSLELTSPLPFDPLATTGKLSNGLVYYIRHNEKPENRVELRLAVKTGSTMENDDQQGLAHLIEHMAFNGTKNFKKNELINYLEKIGTKFGPHLNAYTSFDETVYMMQVPTDSASFVLKGMQILEDWAHNISFEGEEIDKERGVVVEEWRTRLGAGERMRNIYWPVLYKDSRYENRLPIGKPDIIKNAPYEKLTSFYKDWYRPDNMAVIIVGDVDVAEMEKLVKKHFSSIANPTSERKVELWPIPDHADLRIVHARDKEATRTNIQVIYKHPRLMEKTVTDYRTQLAIQLYNGMMNDRLGELQKQSDPPFTSASTFYGNMVRTKASFRSSASMAETGIMRGLETLLIENERVRKHGFSATELQRAKKDMLRYYEQAFVEKDKTPSANFVQEYVSHFLEGQPSPGIEFEQNIAKKYLDGITLDEINALAKKWITDKGANCTVVIQAPEKETVIIPTDPEIRKLFESIGSKKIEPYIDQFLDQPLVSTLPNAGSILKENHNEELDYTTWTLSNGATVLWKKTDFKGDQILFSASSFGGSSLCSDSDFISAQNASSIVQNSGLGDFNQVQLQKALSGKIANVFSYITETSEGMSGSASPQDLETLLQLAHLRFRTPRKDEDGFNSFISQQKTALANRSVDPATAFRDTINVTLSSYHLRRKPTSIADIENMDHEKALHIFSERFANAGDFDFVFIGNIDEKMLKPLVEKYIASLPNTGANEKWNDVGVNYPKGKISKTVKRGIEDKASVNLSFYGPSKYSQKNRMYMDGLTKLLQVKLRESLREEHSGTYGVSCSGFISRIPKEQYNITVSWGCAPANVELLKAAAISVIEDVKKNGCTSDDLIKIRESFRRERETNLKENNYWSGVLSTMAIWGDSPTPEQEFESFLTGLNSNDMINLAKQYFNFENSSEFILVPER